MKSTLPLIAAHSILFISCTLAPTPTPMPTAALVPTPSPSPMPTNTPTSTSTPLPTATKEPTATPVPIAEKVSVSIETVGMGTVDPETRILKSQAIPVGAEVNFIKSKIDGRIEGWNDLVHTDKGWVDSQSLGIKITEAQPHDITPENDNPLGFEPIDQSIIDGNHNNNKIDICDPRVDAAIKGIYAGKFIEAKTNPITHSLR